MIELFYSDFWLNILFYFFFKHKDIHAFKPTAKKSRSTAAKKKSPRLSTKITENSKKNLRMFTLTNSGT